MAVRDPVAIMRFITTGQSGLMRLSHARLLSFLGIEASTLESYLAEFKAFTDARDLESAIRRDEVATGSRLIFGEDLCQIIRAQKPDTVVETGVASGYSSLCILNALQSNGSGHLYSIEPTEGAGWLVPEEFRPRWTLLHGKSKDMLPPLLQKLRKIDIFLHDSDHSYENMTYEFRKSWQYLAPNGVLVSDDITSNNSFFDFCKAGQVKSTFLYRTLPHRSVLGLIRRPAR